MTSVICMQQILPYLPNPTFSIVVSFTSDIKTTYPGLMPSKNHKNLPSPIIMPEDNCNVAINPQCFHIHITAVLLQFISISVVMHLQVYYISV
jgi:hypothetical protein